MEAALSESLVKRLVEFNFDVDDYPRFEFVEFAVGIFISFSQSVANLVNTGLKIPEDWVYEKLHIPRPKEGEKVLEMAQPQTGWGGQPGQGLDNKTKMQAFIEDFRTTFQEDSEASAIFKNLDRLSERYRDLLAGEFDKLAEKVKKKSLTPKLN